MGYDNPFRDLSDGPLVATDTPLFHKEKHVNYWLRCLRSPLPHQYTHNDSNRMTLVFFTLSALDFLGVLFTRTSTGEREEYKNWIYDCQHPAGGFRGFPGTNLGPRATAQNAVWDPANVPATYFATAALLVLGDDLGRLNRRGCLHWLTRMQRADGSFGETLGPEDRIEGGRDTRYAYCATVVRWFLRGNIDGEFEGVPDIRVDDLVECIKGSETFDGGISDEPYHEAHAGFTYCAIGALALLNRLPFDAADPLSRSTASSKNGGSNKPGLSDLRSTVRWLISRMTTTIDEDDYGVAGGDDDSFSDNNSSLNELEMGCSIPDSSSSATTPESTSFIKLQSAAVSPMESLGLPSALTPSVFYPMHTQWVGFNGRVNKIADTCYVFWAGASLSILNRLSLISATPIRRYLCEKTQHSLAGGFSKLPGDPPDMYHAYLGLTALALLDIGKAGEEGVLAKDVRHSASNTSRKNSVKPVLDAQHPDPEHGANVEEMNGGEGESEGGMDMTSSHSKSVFRSSGGENETPDTSGARRWSGEGQRVNIQLIDAEMQDNEGWGEGGEVGDGGGVLRRLDPALCVSVRARKWLEGLQWRRQIVGEDSKEQVVLGA